MSIVFTNPRGMTVRVNPEEAEVVEVSDEGTTYMARDEATGEMMMAVVPGDIPGGIVAEEEMDHPMSMESDYERQSYDEHMNMIEDVESNPPKKLFTWKNLRLQSAIAGEKTVKGRLSRAAGTPGALFGAGKRFVARELSAKQSIRDSPFLLQLATAEQWYDYISNMARNPVDMGAELSASVTPSQKIAVAMFVREAESDPGFSNLMRKAVPGADTSEIVTMATIIKDLMTGKGPNPLQAKGYGTFKYDKMFRLAYDILVSMPIKQYNSYTLFQLEADEGGQVFAEVTRNYTPLEMSEVGLVLELRDKLAEFGPAYANMAVAEASLAAEAGALMQKAVSAYSSGDTVTVRSILNYLQESPFYYKSVASGAKNILEAKDGDIVGVRLEGTGKQDVPVSNGLVYLKGFPRDLLDEEKGKPKDKPDADKKKWSNSEYEVVKSPFDTTVAGVLKFQGASNKYAYTPGVIKKKQPKKDKKSTAGELADILEGRENPRGKPTGRGKYYNLEVHAKSNLDMKLKPTTSGGQGDLRHGAPPKGKDGSQNTWTKGLYKLLQADVEAINKKHMRDKKTRKPKLPALTVMVTGGKHKKTGKWAPYRIKLPKSHFATSRLPDGTQSVGLRSGKATPAMKKAWQAFTDEYGIFMRKDNKGTEFRFVPSKKAEHRGAYQDRFRRQVGGAKRSR